jgi:hypothetical protein
VFKPGTCGITARKAVDRDRADGSGDAGQAQNLQGRQFTVLVGLDSLSITADEILQQAVVMDGPMGLNRPDQAIGFLLVSESESWSASQSP